MEPAIHDLTGTDQTIVSRDNEAKQSPIFDPIQKGPIVGGTITESAHADVNTDSTILADVEATKIVNDTGFSPSSAEDGPEIVDISMWTQTSPVSSSASHRRPDSDERSRCNVSTSRHSHDSGYDARSESLGSEGDVPFANGGHTPVAGPSNTITLQSPTATVIAPQILSIGSQEISLFEGPSSLSSLPLHLYEQLKSYCQKNDTDYPDIIKSKWPASGIHHTSKGNRTWFEAPQNCERLTAARYRYGRSGQVIVIRDDARRQFNGGRAAIVTHDDSATVKRQMNGQSCILHRWHVWDPFGEQPQPLSCWKVIEMPSVRSTPATNSKSEHGAARVKPLPVVAPESSKASSLKRRDLPRSTDLSRGNGDLTVMRGLKRSSSVVEMKPLSKNPRLSLNDVDDILSRAEHLPGMVGARRDETSGEILVKRKSDGKVVMLRCPECDYDGYQTQQGLYNHLLYRHDIRLDGREAVADHCGVPFDAAAPKSNPIVPRKSAQEVQSATATPLRTQPSRRTTQHVSTSSTSINNIGHGNDEARFMFMKSPPDSNARIRPLSSVNTAEKLFVNAVVAGVARKDTLMLTVIIAGGRSFYIVKDDHEDFELILKRIEESECKNPLVIITVEDLDD